MTATAAVGTAIERVVRLPALHAGRNGSGGQQRVLAEADRFNVLQCGRRWGKTTLGQDLAANPALDGYPVGWFAPTYKYLDEPFNALARILADVVDRMDRQGRRIHLVTGGLIDFWSLEDENAGRSRKYKRAIIDEFGIVRNLEEAWSGAIRPTLTDYQGDAWFLGTPKGRNYAHQLFVKGQTGEGGWQSWRFGTADNPFIALEEIEAARADLPEAAFRQEYLGEPADDGGNPFGLDALRACVGPMSAAPPAVWGVDLAKSEDWTVAIALDASGNVCRFERWQGPWEVTMRRLAALIGQTTALVDSTGVGDPIVEQLQRECRRVEGFKFTAPSKQQLMEGLAVHIQQRKGTVPDGPILREAETFEYEYTRTGVRYSAPEGLHDDCVCAWALAVWKQGHRLPEPRSRLLGGAAA